MAESVEELTTERRARLWSTLRRLDDEEVRSRVEQSYLSTEPSIEEWHDFVEGVELATRHYRPSEVRQTMQWLIEQVAS